MLPPKDEKSHVQKCCWSADVPWSSFSCQLLKLQCQTVQKL